MVDIQMRKLSPSTQQGHQTSTNSHDNVGNNHTLEALVTLELVGEQELTGHQLDKTSVKQNTSRDGVKDTVDNLGSTEVLRVSVSDTKTNGNGNWSGQTVSGSQQPWSPSLVSWPWSSSDSGTQTQTFEELVEHNDWVQGLELVVSSGKRQTNENRVENDTEFQDKDSQQLTVEVRSVFSVRLWSSRVDFLSSLRVCGIRVLARAKLDLLVRLSVVLHVVVGVAKVRVGVTASTVVKLLVDVSESKHFNKENDEKRHKTDTVCIRIDSPAVAQTFIAQVISSRLQQVNEGSSDNDTGTKELGNEETPARHSDERVSGRQDWEHSTKGGCNQHHEHRRDTGTQHAAVLVLTTFIFSLLESVHDGSNDGIHDEVYRDSEKKEDSNWGGKSRSYMFLNGSQAEGVN